MRTVIQGNAAEAAVLHALARAGLPALLPFGNGLPFDLAAVLPNGRIVRIQVKAGRVRHGCVEFNSASTDHGAGQRDYRGRADFIAVSVPALEDCPISRGYLRLEPQRTISSAASAVRSGIHSKSGPRLRPKAS